MTANNLSKISLIYPKSSSEHLLPSIANEIDVSKLVNTLELAQVVGADPLVSRPIDQHTLEGQSVGYLNS